MNIAQIQFACEFAKDDSIILTLGHSIKELRQKRHASIRILNTPKQLPPEIPRLLVTYNTLSLNVGLNRYDVFLFVPDHINKNLNASLTFVENTIKDLLPYIVFEDFSYKWIGLVANLEYPSPNKDTRALKVVEPIFDKLLNIARNARDLATFQIQFGFLESDYYKNYTVGGYDKTVVDLSSVQSQPVSTTISPNVSEAGISVAIDINNKPDLKKTDLTRDLKRMLDEFRLTYNGLAQTLNLKGVL